MAYRTGLGGLQIHRKCFLRDKYQPYLISSTGTARNYFDSRMPPQLTQRNKNWQKGFVTIRPCQINWCCLIIASMIKQMVPFLSEDATFWQKSIDDNNDDQEKGSFCVLHILFMSSQIKGQFLWERGIAYEQKQTKPHHIFVYFSVQNKSLIASRICLLLKCSCIFTTE